MSKWTEQYRLFREGKFKGKYLIVGHPSQILLKAGIPNAEIRIGIGNMENHFQKHTDVTYDDLEPLDKLIKEPLFILAYYKEDKFAGYSMALNSFDGNRVLYIGLRPIYKNNKAWLEANIITTFHYKPIRQIKTKIKEDNRPLALFVQIKKLNQLLADGLIPSDTKELIQQFVDKYNSKKLPDQMFFEENIRKISSHLSGLGLTDLWQGYIEPDGHTPTYTDVDWDALIPSATMQDVYNGIGSTDKTISGIKNIIRTYYKQMCQVAPHLTSPTNKEGHTSPTRGELKGGVLQTAYNIWHWARTHIRYAHDKLGTEQLRTPARTWADRDRGVDCDDFAILTTSILLCMGYKPKLAVVAYNGSNSYAHIFAVLPIQPLPDGVYQGKEVLKKTIIIDPVDKQFNHPISYITKTKIISPMEQYTLTGITGINEPMPMLAGLGGEHLPPTPLSRRALSLMPKANDRERRKARWLLMHNRSLYALPAALSLPHIHDIAPDGSIVWKDQHRGRIIEKFLSDVEDTFNGILSGTDPDFTYEETAALLGIPIAGMEGLGWKFNLKSAWNKVKNKVTHAYHKATNAIKNVAHKVGKAAGKVWKGTKTVLLAPARTAFLLLVRFNVGGLATKLRIGYLTPAQARQFNIPTDFYQRRVTAKRKMEAFWTKVGGKVTALRNAIAKGAHKRPITIKFLHVGTTMLKLYNAGIRGTEAGLGEAATAAAATTSLPILKKILMWLKDNWKQVADAVSKVAKHLKPKGGEANTPDVSPDDINNSDIDVPDDVTNGGSRNKNTDAGSSKSWLPWVAAAGVGVMLMMKH